MESMPEFQPRENGGSRVASVRHSARAAALTAFFIAAAWLALNVAGSYGGNLTGLFYTGSKAPLPPELTEPHTRRVNDEVGYDGQFYHLIAHDPLLTRGFSSYVDNPRTRWRRIGVPGLAALLTAGSDRYVDFAYAAIQLGFTLLGAYWLSRIASEQDSSRAWGLAFLLVPAVLVSLDRMTVDLPLAALVVGFMLYGAAGKEDRLPSDGALYAVLITAPLVRETGMILVLAWVVYASARHGRAAVAGAACAVPALTWWAYVHSRTSPDGTPWLAAYPFGGVVARIVHGIEHPETTTWLWLASKTEDLAFAGIILALMLPLYWMIRTRSWDLVGIASVLYATFASTLGKFDIWSSAYAAGRTMSPLLILLGLIALRERTWFFAIPMLFVLPRFALQYQAQLKLALQGIL